jgi:hypothetical protein
MKKVVQQLDLQQEYYAAGIFGNLAKYLVSYTADQELSLAVRQEHREPDHGCGQSATCVRKSTPIEQEREGQRQRL